MGIDTVHKINT